MLQIDLHENQIEFAITFNGTNNFMEIKDDVKDIPSRRFDMDSKIWLVPVSQNSFESMKALAEKWGFTITEKANEALTLAKASFKIRSFQKGGVSYGGDRMTISQEAVDAIEQALKAVKGE